MIIVNFKAIIQNPDVNRGPAAPKGTRNKSFVETIARPKKRKNYGQNETLKKVKKNGNKWLSQKVYRDLVRYLRGHIVNISK